MSIYQQFDRATGSYTATAILFDGKVVGRLVIKFGAAATAYFQVWGVEMTKGVATGGSYDKATAAVEAAVMKTDIRDGKVSDPEALAVARRVLDAFALAKDGTRYSRILEDAGFTLALVI